MPAPISYQSLNQVGYLGVNSPQQQFQKAPAGSYNQGQQYGSYNGQYQSINPQNGNNYQTINSQQYQNNYSQVNNQQFNSSQYQNNSPVIRNNYSQGISTPPLSYNGLGYGTSHLPSSPQTNNVYPTQYTSPVNQPPQIPIKSPYRQEVNPQAIPPPTSSKYSTLASIPFQSPQIPQKALLNSPPPVAPRPASLRPSVESRPLTGPALPRKPNIDLSMITRTNTMEYPSSPIHAQFGISGLRNLGNTCFMNSTLQCLSATIPFARYFLGGSYKRHIARNNPLGSKGKVAEAFASLIQSVWSGEESVVNPSSFKQCIGLIHPSFAGNEQQDSHEFLSFILDQLHEDLNIARRPFPENGPDLDSELYQEKEFMQIETRKYHLRNWSIVVDMFQGILKSVLQCLKCGKVIFN
jgi:ubiquitin carboxyl-terminal hydrolase 8